ncbi:MAG: MerR family transcriptional regulator [Vicinamibacterales bacterium]|nr:MerR family transcriptional regulator [Vicinamibacterales bacterium]
MTVSALARRCGISRSTVLYYESIGLLTGAARTTANYRVYDERHLRRLQQVRIYREAGLELADIKVLVEDRGGRAADVLARRLVALDAQIARLRSHQRAIAHLLPRTGHVRGREMISKDKWVEVMRASGFSDEDMHRWHAEFERSAPDEHQEFLQFLHIPAEDIARIREWSRAHRERA